MKWLTKWWMEKERKNLSGITMEEMRIAQKALASYPIKNYLIAIMDEVIRQGIFLSQEKQRAAIHSLELLKREIEKGEILLDKEHKEKK